MEDLKPFRNDPENQELDLKKIMSQVKTFKNNEELEQEKQHKIDETIMNLKKAIAALFCKNK